MKKNGLVRLTVISLLCMGTEVWALDLDWSGQFRADTNWLFNYAMDSDNVSSDAARLGKGGYYIPGGGEKNAYFQSVFFRLRPSLIVNDNIYIKSEWWIGDPVFGFFGNGASYSFDQRQYNSTFSRGSSITAQRFWAEFLSNVGTVQIGRAPLNWGLGLVWNSGKDLWHHYASTGDVIRLISKFGTFSVSPGIVKYSTGNNIGGSCPDPVTGLSVGGSCSTSIGGGGVSDYSLMFKYDNPDEDIELGLNFVKRLAGAAQDPVAGFQGIDNGISAGMNFNTWDIYGRKRLGAFSVAGELPVVTGQLGSSEYRTYAIAVETEWDIASDWKTKLKTGLAPGQPNTLNASPSVYKGFYFHPNYQVGLIMFNYQLRGFAGPSTLNNSGTSPSALLSPFDNPIVNAKYLNVDGSFRTGKWDFHTNWLFAGALETATAEGRFFNTWERKYYDFNPAASAQKSFLGWEMDYGTTFFWDDSFQFLFDFGLYFPGDYYKFSNTAQENKTAVIFATVFKVGVVF